jgi:ABC-type phosphate transport system substrate-binding protein
MRGNWQRVAALGGILSTVAALVVAAPSLAGPPGTAGGPTPDNIIGSGSDTSQILMLHLDGLYNVSEGCKQDNGVGVLDLSCLAPDPTSPVTIVSENYEHDIIREADFVGSSVGIKQLCTQGVAGTLYIDFARSSRGPSGDCTGLHFVAYARDGVSVEASDTAVPLSGIHGMSNGDPLCAGLGWCITQFQLKAIYANCTLDSWNDGTAAGVNSTNLGGNAAAGPIEIYTPQSGSGTRSAFEKFLGAGVNSSGCIVPDGQPISQAGVPENQNTGIVAADIPHFIFPFSYAIFHTEVNPTNTTASSTFLLAAIDGVAVTAATIANSTFPYGRFIYNVFCSTTAAGTCGAVPGHIVTQKTVDYIGEEGWICKPGTNENALWVGNGNVPALDASQPDAQAPHVTSPHYQANWATLISKKIQSRGFGAIGIGLIGGGDPNSDHCRLTVT